MTIQLNSEQENVIGEAIRAGLIRTQEDVAEIGLASIRQQLVARSEFGATSLDEWSRALVAWSESHPVEAPLLSEAAINRESIYGERGL